MHGRLFVGPGFEHVGNLYDERLADLEDLKAYTLTSRHPKEDMHKAKQLMPRSESVMSRRLSSTGGSLLDA
jgi:hypothetical protein